MYYLFNPENINLALLALSQFSLLLWLLFTAGQNLLLCKKESKSSANYLCKFSLIIVLPKEESNDSGQFFALFINPERDLFLQRVAKRTDSDTKKRAQSSGDNRSKGDKASLVIGDFHVDSSPSPFRLSTTNCSEDSNQFSSLISADSSIKAAAPEAKEAMTTSLKSRIKAVQDKYLRSSTSVTKLIKFKLQSQKSKENLSKFRSSSHGALPSLDEFGGHHQNVQNDEEDDFNGIWSASHMASKQKDSSLSKKATVTTALQVHSAE